MNKNYLLLKIREAVKALPALLAHLSPVSIKALGGYEGIRNDYWAEVYDAVEGYLTGNRPITSFRNGMWNAMNSAFQTAFEMGYVDGGGEVPVDAKAQAWLDGMIAQEKGFISGLFADLRDYWSDKDAIAEAFARADGYASTLDQIYNTGKTFGAANKMLTMTGSDGKESCKDCQRLKGQRHRASWWAENNLIPGSSAYECGGWNCEHILVDDDGVEFTF